jgi:hypothetical protein
MDRRNHGHPTKGGVSIGRFQLDDPHTFHEDIGARGAKHASSMLVDLLQESRAEGVGHLENSSEHQRPIIMKCRSPQNYYWPPMDAEERGY